MRPSQRPVTPVQGDSLGKVILKSLAFAGVGYYTITVIMPAIFAGY